ncbi:hypothetical protein [Mastigocoleus testarum]|uniref:hypothetical protein n=1 Tax=Mastigocoleus testarum TaxID=996925 RepID=UPI000403C32D|nr:hypothetical protein [Mastigocoleus testarum]
MALAIWRLGIGKYFRNYDNYPLPITLTITHYPLPITTHRASDAGVYQSPNPLKQ